MQDEQDLCQELYHLYFNIKQEYFNVSNSSIPRTTDIFYSLLQVLSQASMLGYIIWYAYTDEYFKQMLVLNDELIIAGLTQFQEVEESVITLNKSELLDKFQVQSLDSLCFVYKMNHFKKEIQKQILKRVKQDGLNLIDAISQTCNLQHVLRDFLNEQTYFQSATALFITKPMIQKNQTERSYFVGGYNVRPSDVNWLVNQSGQKSKTCSWILIISGYVIQVLIANLILTQLTLLNENEDSTENGNQVLGKGQEILQSLFITIAIIFINEFMIMSIKPLIGLLNLPSQHNTQIFVMLMLSIFYFILQMSIVVDLNLQQKQGNMQNEMWKQGGALETYFSISIGNGLSALSETFFDAEYFLHILLRKWHYYRMKKCKLVQYELNQLYEKESLTWTDKIAFMNFLIFASILFSQFLPICLPACIIVLILTYYLQKYLYLNRYSKSNDNKYNPHIIVQLPFYMILLNQFAIIQSMVQYFLIGKRPVDLIENTESNDLSMGHTDIIWLTIQIVILFTIYFIQKLFFKKHKALSQHQSIRLSESDLDQFKTLDIKQLGFVANNPLMNIGKIENFIGRKYEELTNDELNNYLQSMKHSPQDQFLQSLSVDLYNKLYKKINKIIKIQPSAIID
ncbi:unnamed protein product (macronuclear) [Paramecium tetraurelia]|uniref:CSC1/OSCA1-like cytosolic domain-containing protein n=1 Tax=Paramecium tetraurelia TaxID=5888 RepID=A0E311_PARTE|nr:uncharacterized protein GSPATT00022851001 [Paramecium tetraurelia]CAK89678.1 unnamed protein product [Paramecium tetraurelia]|eukprot:XP_001457075.1 hypothetical protein (macronuclear) [Paramecium tetraurelia strain d4-2]